MTRKFSKKMKYILTILMLAIAIVLPCQKLLVVASEMQPIKISTTDGGESGGSGTQDGTSGGSETQEGSSGGSATGGESGGSATEEELPPPPDELLSGTGITSSMVTDSGLFASLLDLFKGEYPGYTGDTLSSKMFTEFTHIELDNKNVITSLEGLQYFDFFNLESFTANLNSISSFSEKYFENTDKQKFKTLSLAGNEISSFAITKPTGSRSYDLTGLTNINLSSNNLTSIDVGNIDPRLPNTTFTLNVANNNINSMSDIVLPRSMRVNKVNLNIINNGISDIGEEYFTTKYKLNIGLQGFSTVNDKNSTDTKMNVKIYKSNISGLSLQIYKVDEDFSEDPDYVFSDSDITEGHYLQLNLPIGEYEYYYALNGEKLLNSNRKYDIDKLYLKNGEFSVLPQKVTYLLNYKGEDYTELGKVTGEVLVKLSCEEGAIILYSVNGGKWVEGNEINCNQGGSYSISVKCIKDGLESETEGIWVRTSLNLYVSDGLMLALVLMIAIVLFFVVIPIISKKYFKRD